LEELNGSAASFRTVGAEITQETGDFFVSDAEGDPDKPTEGFSSIEDALNSLRKGKVRENKSKINTLFSEQKIVSLMHATLGHGPYLILVMLDIACTILQRYA
jgi:hypothetical protein